MFFHRYSATSIFTAIVCIACLAPATCDAQAGLTVHGHGYAGRDWYYSDINWLSVSVEDSNGDFVTGLGLDDFVVTESFVPLGGGDPVEGPYEVDIAAQILDGNYDGGFWEDSVGDLKVDIVFIVDQTASMSDDIMAINAEAHAFVDRLVSHNVDFRIAGVGIDETPEGYAFSSFHSNQEMDEVREGIDYIFSSAGDWWSPTTAWDALLWTPWLGYREDAYKVCVIITDITPQTMYGTFWYAPSCTTATLSAVEFFLTDTEANTDIDVYYCLDPDEDVDFEYYYDSSINSRAGDDQSGLAALENLGLATGLRSAPGADPWPFEQDILWGQLVQDGILPSSPLAVTDSKYYLTWDTSLEGTYEVNVNWEDYRLQIIVQVPDPDQPGQFLTASCLNPVKQPDVDLTLNVTDETGNPVTDAWAYLYYPIGDHLEDYIWQNSPDENGRITDTAAPGTYAMVIRDGGHWPFAYQYLRLLDRSMIEIPSEGLTLDVTVDTADREMELAKVRGLLRDIKEWNVTGSPPFRAFAEEAETWLDSLDEGGISWLEMERIKRFYIALTGIVNNSAYAQTEAAQSIEDFQIIVHNIIDIIAAVQETDQTIQEPWRQVLGIVLEIVYDIFTKGEFTAKKQAVEQGLDKLLDYAEEKLVAELKQHVMEQIPAGRYKAPIKGLLDYCTDDEIDYKDWDAVLDAIKGLAFNVALEAAADRFGEEAVDAIFEEIDAPGPVAEVVKLGVKNIMIALVKSGMDGFDDAMEDMYLKTSAYVDDFDVHEEVDRLFSSSAFWSDDEDMGILKEFTLGMTHDFAHLAIPNDDAHQYRQIDNDEYIDVIVKHAVYTIFLKRYYVDKVRTGLDEALDRAQVYVPEGEDRSDWTQAMSSDFFDYRKIVEPLQNQAWNALGIQEPLDAWVDTLEGFVALIEPISDALEFLSFIYPPFDGIAEKLDTLVVVINGLQIVPKAVEFGLEIDCLDRFGSAIHKMYEQAFPGFEQWQSSVTIWATEAGAVEGVAGDIVEFTVIRTGDLSMDVPVNYAVFGTTTNGVDYHALPGVVMLRAGEDTATITIEPIADNLAENTEVVFLVLDTGAYDISFPNIANAMIEDELMPAVSIEATTPAAIEGAFPVPAVPGEFTVTRETDISTDITVNYRIWGTAENGTDYESLGDSVSIPAGHAYATIAVTPLADDDYEGSETVNITLTDGAYALGTSMEAAVYITDNGAGNSVFVNATADIASESGTLSGEFTITRIGSTDRDLTVEYSLEGTAYNGSDYTTLFASVTIPAGESSVTIEVAAIHDDSIEGDETVVINLVPLDTIPDEEEDDYIIGYPSAATVTIVDADSTVVGVAVTDGVAAEGEVVDTGVFTISRAGDTSTDLTVNYTLSGTAQNGVDYDFLSGTADIHAGQMSVSVTVLPVDDSDIESNESVAIAVAEGSYIIGADDTVSITIWDDEQSSSSWHVSADSGNDATGDGSPTSPWSTIGHAMTHAVSVASDATPITIYVDEGTFEEPVVLVPHVSLVGAGPDLTTLRYYDENDTEHVVITAADNSAISGCTISLPDMYDDVTVLLKIDEVVMHVTDCVFDGNDNEQCTAIQVSGMGSSDSVISDCTITNVGTGIWAEFTGVTVSGNLFENISGNAVYVLPVIAKDSDTPYLGGFDEQGVSGMNRFRNIGGLFVQNHSGSDVHAGYNDWGVYTTEEIAAKMNGSIDFDSYLTEELSAGTLFVQLVDDTTREVITGAAIPAVVIDGGNVTATFDPDSSMFSATDLDGTYTIEASADGYEPAERDVVVPEGASVVEILALAPAPSILGDVDNTGLVDAIDVQLVINEALDIDTQQDCDINDDGKVDAVDVQLVINAALGIPIQV